ncbi:MAG: C10 family peptidase [Prevotella sp.]|uniref:C10 family peptidase n=1 Tax=Prevotella sp. TaxID=59823 RepID=UPI002A2A527A|nr:C10 family peptidase [Prevotella sp.]MDD7318216.1 C10 family peptidase [Prevotellaceae bacterium]MDY4020895.1 C10 family peptidase [Prevotella sp.]
MKYSNRICVLAVIIAYTISSMAAPRSEEQIKDIVQGFFSKNALSYFKTQGKGNIELTVLEKNKATRVYGFSAGGFIVVSTDDVMPEILGYSDMQFNSSKNNPGFQWWLNAIEEIGNERAACQQKAKNVSPGNPYPKSVSALLTCAWGQEMPFNNLCPLGTSSGIGGWQGYTDTGHTLSGCVATAMAQIMYYHQYPKSGIGVHEVKVNQKGGKHTTFKYDFGSSIFDYDNMKDTYSHGSYTAIQAFAVANLMTACGVACDMNYATDGSGAYSEKIVGGLVRNFGFSDGEVVFKMRDANMDEAVWMNLIFKELSEKRPILYTASDYSQPFGHAFVLDGYDEMGRVHVNWGWNGDQNGFYDLSTLIVKNFQFSREQDMCIGLHGENIELVEKTVALSSPGALSEAIPANERLNVSTLKLSGKINSSDFKVLREMAGRDAEGNHTKGHLANLDLTNATIVVGGDAYLSDCGVKYAVKEDNSLPEKAFYQCGMLRVLKMPKNIENVENGALAQCRMHEVVFDKNKTTKICVEDNLIYNTDKTELISALPHVAEELHIAKGVKTLRPYCFAGNCEIKKLYIPASVSSLKEAALSHASSLTDVKVYKREVPTAGADCFAYLPSTLVKLYVIKGTYNSFANADQWKNFLDYDGTGIVEFGTTIKAKNTARLYGDNNPTFNWETEGDFVNGTPVLTCIADSKSPVGNYVINIDYGTIDPEGVDLKNGILIISPAQLKVIADDCERFEHEENPDFTITYQGFKNDENESVLEQKPVVTTIATAESPAGEYMLEVKGGKAKNYIFKYVAGKLTVNSVTGIDQITANGNTFDIYNIQGQKIRSNAHGFDGLDKGIYIVNGKKVALK